MAIADILRSPRFAAARSWRVVFIAMIVLLDLAVLRGDGALWIRALMLAHFGLFILWQPFMRSESRLNPPQAVGVIVIAVVILFFLNWWLISLWISVLAGIVAGKVFLFQARWLRRFYLVVFAYLVALLLVWVVPQAFAVSLPGELQLLARYGLPVLFVVMAILPVEADTAETPQIVDFFYAALIFLLLVVLVLGAFAFMRSVNVDYGAGLTYSMLIIAAALLLLSLAWNPRAGFAGLSMYFSRYLLSIGLPFEQWLYFLAELSQMEVKPDRFIKEACATLGRLPWVSGGFWHTAGASGDFGTVSRHSVEFTNPELHLRVYTRPRLSPSLTWHFHLLGQLLGEFHLAKLREQKLQQQTYVQAVHETGARMTHEIRNLLQSLNVLCGAAERGGDTAELAVLMRRQLPEITARLRQTLDKLQRPQSESAQLVPAGQWWEEFKRGYQNRGCEFNTGAVDDGALIPKELFDSACDNFLQNALRKRRLEGSITVSAAFDGGETIHLSVCDSGSPVPPHVVQGLLRQPVPSESGYGIGLYQSARLAESLGFAIALEENEPGKVCFTLSGKARRAAAPS